MIHVNLTKETIMLSCQICENPVVEVPLEDAKILTATCMECWGN
jgi:hypothetical protein